MNLFARGWGINKLLALAATVIFFVAAIGEWPSDLQDDVEPIALGLTLLAASFAMK